MSVIDTIIKTLDPHWYKCERCDEWVHVEDPEQVHSTICQKCMDKMYEKMVNPIVRSYYPKLIAKDLVSVQPMEAPKGLAFALKYKYGEKES